MHIQSETRARNDLRHTSHKKLRPTSCASHKQQAPSHATVHASNQDTMPIGPIDLNQDTSEAGACGVAPIPLKCVPNVCWPLPDIELLPCVLSFELILECQLAL